MGTAQAALVGCGNVLKAHVTEIKSVRIGQQDVSENRSEVSAEVSFRPDMTAAEMDEDLVGMQCYQLGIRVTIETTAADPDAAEERLGKVVDQLMRIRRHGDAATLMQSVLRAKWGDVARLTTVDGQSYVAMAALDIDCAVSYAQT